MLEFEARETDFMLSVAETRADLDRIVKLSAVNIATVVDGTELSDLRSQLCERGYRPKQASLVGECFPALASDQLVTKNFDVGQYPCYVIQVDKLQTFTRLPTHEDALGQRLLDILTPRARSPSPSHCYFVSQNWEGAEGSGFKGKGKHPDNSMNTKMR